jgi:hypothetical protein
MESGSMQILQKFLKHVVPGVIKPIMVLWNEVIGFVFVVLAAFIAVSTYRRAQHFSGDTGGLLILVASFTFAAVLAVYGLLSFRRARKISRS